ncbi:hypothetical protein H3N56_02950 [Cetobacterium sp. 2A]|uniref:hypothetical protein n=1 Tax=Cetobacterium sp. 2A TaxID=2754723 RepID=UPI00163B840E|nr:hypothetical protein [Cetobacterium sp. 2A]MBC2855452.1 hypothetical protein [Cetobacterium sp. 2A]
MQVENICGKAVADEIWRVIETNETLEEYERIMCECGEHEAKFRLTDELGSDLKLCKKCLVEVEQEYLEEETSYEFKNI